LSINQIILKKITKINYKNQFKMNQILKDETETKKSKKRFNRKKIIERWNLKKKEKKGST